MRPPIWQGLEEVRCNLRCKFLGPQSPSRKTVVLRILCCPLSIGFVKTSDHDLPTFGSGLRGFRHKQRKAIAFAVYNLSSEIFTWDFATLANCPQCVWTAIPAVERACTGRFVASARGSHLRSAARVRGDSTRFCASRCASCPSGGHGRRGFRFRSGGWRTPPGFPGKRSSIGKHRDRGRRQPSARLMRPGRRSDDHRGRRLTPKHAFLRGDGMGRASMFRLRRAGTADPAAHESLRAPRGVSNSRLLPPR
jgi:hypothetical protein